MFGQLNGNILELVIEFSLKEVVAISVNIGQNDLDNVVTSLIIWQIDKLSSFQCQNFLIE